LLATGFTFGTSSAGAVESFGRALRLRRAAGKTAAPYTYEPDVEQFFRHSPSVIGPADR
jgi:UDP-glucose 4-epimerase